MDILRNAKTPMPPTRIMYASNLSWKPLQEALSHLVRAGMLQEITPEEAVKRPDTPNPTMGQTGTDLVDGRSKHLYAVSELGKATLKQYEKVLETTETHPKEFWISLL
jgi:predicted transcriptional regulator